MKKLLVLAFPMLLQVVGCAHLIDQKSREMADRTITFSALRENPDAYKGKFIILGGIIAAVRDVQEGTELEVEQHELDSREAPDVTSVSGGRFLATTPEFLPAATCRAGALVSMAGEVAGGKVRKLKGADYTYPVIVIKELHIIKPPDENFFRTWNPYGP